MLFSAAGVACFTIDIESEIESSLQPTTTTTGEMFWNDLQGDCLSSYAIDELKLKDIWWNSWRNKYYEVLEWK